MPKKIIIAIDGMGGDNAPDTILEGMEAARIVRPHLEFLLYGDETLLSPLLKKYPALRPLTNIIHTDSRVSGSDKPGQVLRHGRSSSMGLAIQAVKKGEADVAISAGNTGGLMALSKFILRTIPGIDRPALVSPMPTQKGESVVLDLGANIECSAENLVQFAVMGSAYASAVLGIKRPSVALLNVGVEDMKGNEQVKAASEILKNSPHLPHKFCGFVEGDSIGKGDVDVIVTDGFTGNVALKTAEGTARLVASLLGDALRSTIFTKIGYFLAKRGLKSLKDHLDPNNHNGGMFIGLNGLVVKSHGGANAHGFSSAIATAADLAANDLNSIIQKSLEDITIPDDLKNGQKIPPK